MTLVLHVESAHRPVVDDSNGRLWSCARRGVVRPSVVEAVVDGVLPIGHLRSSASSIIERLSVEKVIRRSVGWALVASGLEHSSAVCMGRCSLWPVRWEHGSSRLEGESLVC